MAPFVTPTKQCKPQKTLVNKPAAEPSSHYTRFPLVASLHQGRAILSFHPEQRFCISPVQIEKSQ